MPQKCSKIRTCIAWKVSQRATAPSVEYTFPKHVYLEEHKSFINRPLLKNYGRQHEARWGYWKKHVRIAVVALLVSMISFRRGREAQTPIVIYVSLLVNPALLVFVKVYCLDPEIFYLLFSEKLAFVAIIEKPQLCSKTSWTSHL